LKGFAIEMAGVIVYNCKFVLLDLLSDKLTTNLITSKLVLNF